jgi:hypothetical protein
LSELPTGQFYDIFFLIQNTKAKKLSPITFITAKVTVALLPQSKMNSLIKRPMVPIISRMKAIKRIDLIGTPHLIVGDH